MQIEHKRLPYYNTSSHAWNVRDGMRVKILRYWSRRLWSYLKQTEFNTWTTHLRYLEYCLANFSEYYFASKLVIYCSSLGSITFTACAFRSWAVNAILPRRRIVASAYYLIKCLKTISLLNKMCVCTMIIPFAIILFVSLPVLHSYVIVVLYTCRIGSHETWAKEWSFTQWYIQ